MQKNVASQKWVVFAFDETDNTAKTGDAAQITAEISADGAAGGGNITDTNPTELEDGYYVFDITQGESNADYLLILPESSTGNIQVIGVPGAVWTTAPAINTLTVAAIQTEMEENGASLLDTIRDDLDNATDGLGALKALIDALNDIAAADVWNATVDEATAGPTPTTAKGKFQAMFNRLFAKRTITETLETAYEKDDSSTMETWTLADDDVTSQRTR